MYSWAGCFNQGIQIKECKLSSGFLMDINLNQTFSIALQSEKPTENWFDSTSENLS